MEQDKFWEIFESSGKIEDYLKYKGISLGQNVGINVGEIDETVQSEGNSNKGDTI